MPKFSHGAAGIGFALASGGGAGPAGPAGATLDQRITDSAGTRWSRTENRADPPGLEPSAGWMQGAAGIAGWLLRLARIERDDPSAPRICGPDNVCPAR